MCVKLIFLDFSFDIESYESSLLRHVQKYLANKYEGGNIEKEEDHLSAILFNAFGIIHDMVCVLN